MGLGDDTTAVGRKFLLPKEEIGHLAIIVSVALVACAIATYLSWPALSALVGISNALSLILSTYGLIGAFVGFYIAIRQIVHAGSLAEVAADASRKAKSRFAAYDVTSEVARATSALRETQRHLSGGNWSYAIDSMSEARISLTRLEGLPSKIDASGRTQIARMIGDIDKYLRRIRTSLVKDIDFPEVAPAQIAMSDYEVFLTRISLVLEKQI
ncbi:hypothetical protein [Brevundimonas lutea]|uniref:hypothetical protein n=1 Tax=Brevundimonas lutea TaxID=2293980 RepID=UPI0013CECFF3|nr:hypothetical protein [Brevundimonas lutea]